MTKPEVNTAHSSPKKKRIRVIALGDKHLQNQLSNDQYEKFVDGVVRSVFKKQYNNVIFTVGAYDHQDNFDQSTYVPEKQKKDRLILRSQTKTTANSRQKKYLDQLVTLSDVCDARIHAKKKQRALENKANKKDGKALIPEHKVNKKACYVNEILLADIFGETEIGEQFENTFNQAGYPISFGRNKILFSKAIQDTSGFLVLYAQVHQIKLEKSHAQIVYDFMGLKSQEQKRELIAFLQNHKGDQLLPRGVTVRIKVGKELYKIKGRGIIDDNFRSNVIRMAEKAGLSHIKIQSPDEKKSTNVIHALLGANLNLDIHSIKTPSSEQQLQQTGSTSSTPIMVARSPIDNDDQIVVEEGPIPLAKEQVSNTANTNRAFTLEEMDVLAVIAERNESVYPKEFNRQLARLKQRNKKKSDVEKSVFEAWIMSLQYLRDDIYADINRQQQKNHSSEGIRNSHAVKLANYTVELIKETLRPTTSPENKSDDEMRKAQLAVVEKYAKQTARLSLRSNIAKAATLVYVATLTVLICTVVCAIAGCITAAVAGGLLTGPGGLFTGLLGLIAGASVGAKLGVMVVAPLVGASVFTALTGYGLFKSEVLPKATKHVTKQTTAFLAAEQKKLEKIKEEATETQEQAVRVSTSIHQVDAQRPPLSIETVRRSPPKSQGWPNLFSDKAPLRASANIIVGSPDLSLLDEQRLSQSSKEGVRSSFRQVVVT
ncbi:MAG TPA: hypothetical protein VHZ76_02580 [Gammaproteobacteria bacterium]|jgi:hypothetical protein|nr:hypothetical protein [Gammaproteobacteria bacterium]